MAKAKQAYFNNLPKRPRQYAVEVALLPTHSERKDFINSRVPEDCRALTVTHLKITLERRRHDAKIKAERAKQLLKRKTKKESFHRMQSSRYNRRR